MAWVVHFSSPSGQNTDPQSMDYPDGLHVPKWTTGTHTLTLIIFLGYNVVHWGRLGVSVLSITIHLDELGQTFQGVL